MKNKTKITLVNVVICLAIVFGITFLWQGLELYMYGEVQHRAVDDVIGTILIVSLIANVWLIQALKMLKDRYLSFSELVEECKKDSELMAEANLSFFHVLTTIKFCMAVMDKVLSDTMDNENGKDTYTVKFQSIKDLAVYIKAMNDTNIHYVEQYINAMETEYAKSEKTDEDTSDGTEEKKK